MENNNTCICCGEPIPEGRQICPHCEKTFTMDAKYDPLEDIKDELEKAKKEVRSLRSDLYAITIAFAIIFVIHLYLIFG